MTPKLDYKAALPIAEIEISPYNVRKHIDDADPSLKELAESIREIDLQQPVVVYKKGGKYLLLIGQRRFLACKRLGWAGIPALITSVSDDSDALASSFSENIQRLDLDYDDKMRVALALRKQLGSVQKVAKKLGVTPGTVRKYLGFEGVEDELKDLVRQGRISAKTAIEIARHIPDPKRAVAIGRKVIEEPSRDKRRILVALAKDHPERTPDEIAQLARSTRWNKVTLNLTPRVREALNRAAEKYRVAPSDLATEIVEEWLTRKGFLR
jgi:ParB family chromosome partitioning protein